jgi:hypothetical protein
MIDANRRFEELAVYLARTPDPASVWRQIPSLNTSATRAVGQPAVRGDVVGGGPAAERLGDDQRRVVGRRRHAVGKAISSEV